MPRYTVTALNFPFMGTTRHRGFPSKLVLLSAQTSDLILRFVRLLFVILVHILIIAQTQRSGFLFLKITNRATEQERWDANHCGRPHQMNNLYSHFQYRFFRNTDGCSRCIES